MLSLNEKKEFLKLESKYQERHHKMKMEQLNYQRETSILQHDQEMERQRIKTAEIRKAFERKQASQYPRGKTW